jgi:hypothetical protein
MTAKGRRRGVHLGLASLAVGVVIACIALGQFWFLVGFVGLILLRVLWD